MISWWTGDGDATDLVGLNDGSLKNGAAVFRGEVADGFQFDGDDDYLVASTVDLPTGEADRTIELWARIDSQVAQEAFFAGYGVPTSYQSYALGTSNSQLFVSTWGPAIVGPTLETGRWYHVAATNTGSSFNLYLDGTEVAAGIMSVNTPASSPFYMGRYSPDATGDIRRLDGMVDEVSVYDRALSAAEISSIYEAGPDGKVKPYMVINNSSPAQNETVTDPPTDFVIDFSFPVNADTLQPEDLVVSFDGTDYTPDSVSLDDSDTARFSFDRSPINAQGQYTMSMPADAVEPDSTIPANPQLQAWTANFRYDAQLMAVTATQPTDGSVVTLPWTSLAVTFNELYDPASADSGDLVLSQGYVVGPPSTSDPSTVVYTLAGIEREEPLTLSIPAGALTDVYGNPMAAYEASFTLDFGTVPLPAQFEPLDPRGSLVYEANVSGTLASTEDSDSFTITPDPGQTITVVVHPDSNLTPRIDLADTSELLASEEAAGPGEVAVIQTVGPTSGGTYTITVGAVGGSQGAFSLQVILNSAVEQESHGGADNDEILSAQSIDVSFVPVLPGVTGSPTRGAVRGAMNTPFSPQRVLDDFEDGNLKEYREKSTSNTSITSDPSYVHNGTYALKDETNSGLLGWLYRTDAAAQVQRGEVISAWVLSESGTDWSQAYVGFGTDRKGTLAFNMSVNTGELLIHRVSYSGNSVSYENLVRVPQTWLGNHWYRMEVTWGTDGDIIGRLFDSDGTTLLNTVRAHDDQYTSGGIGFRAFGSPKYFDTVEATPIVMDPDVYSFTLEANQPVTLALEASGGDAHLELLDGSGTKLADGSAGAANLSEVVEFAGGAPGTYYARITGDLYTQYELVVVADATFDTNGADFATAQDITGQSGVLGAVLQTTWDDYYQITVPAAEISRHFQLSTTTPMGGGGEFVNALNPKLQLYDAAGVELAADADSADGRNALLYYTLPPEAGTYTIKVSAEDLTVGEYFLETDVFPGPPPVPGITVSKTAVTTTEAGGEDTFTLVLNTDPGVDVTVTIGLHSSDVTEGTIDRSQVVFTGGTGGNWNTPQEVVVTGQDDLFSDGSISYTIETDPAVVSGGLSLYDGIDAADIVATNIDNDVASLVVTPTAIITYEDSEQPAAIISVALNSQPLAEVTISVSSSDTSEGSVQSPASLVFTPDNWSTTQTVTVQGVDDPEADTDVAYVVNLSASSSDTQYDGLSRVVSATNIDNDALPPPSTFAIGDVSKREGRVGKETTFTFTVTRSGDTSQAVTIWYATADDTATGTDDPELTDGDYLATSGWLAFAEGETTKTISVTVYGDSNHEEDEFFFFRLSLTDDDLTAIATAVGKIINDDK